MNYAVNAALFASITILPVIVERILKQNHKKKLIELKSEKNDYYHEIVFINMKNFDCRLHLIKRYECGDFCSAVHYKRFKNFMLSAKKSISICMYMMTFEEIAELLIRAHIRGIKVRVLMDLIMSETKESKYTFLKKAGIPIKCGAKMEMMHHKFCLLDEEDSNLGKIMFGSLNLTNQAFSRNFDMTVYSNNSNIISRFSDEFEDLWSYL
ncbi:unnamed protein product [Brassicogethes aeneus]|uniref:Mitochondrial cardiolipin hydrolase n=1 Tax=Brassicogethes aeneus TaxID=1431903 RepID=A0A9P0ATT2_BRAAE|nr:unnamed protein product [Brassicogethes aeneus]